MVDVGARPEREESVPVVEVQQHEESEQQSEAGDPDRGGSEHRPREQRHSCERHAGRAQAEDGRGQAHRGEDQRHDHHGESGEEEIDALVVASERSAVDEVAHHDHAAADEERPERRGSGTRKGDGLRAHLARNDDHGDADEDRDREQEQAADPVQRQRLRVVVLVEDVVGVGLQALGAEDAAEDSGDHEEDQRGADPETSDGGVPAGPEDAGEATSRDDVVRWCLTGRRARRARPRAESRSSPWLAPDSIHARSAVGKSHELTPGSLTISAPNGAVDRGLSPRRAGSRT